MTRIAYGGFQHETNTFAPDKAAYNDFVVGGGRPSLASGAALWPAIAGANLPAAGFAQAAMDGGATLVPTTWAAASPSAHVTDGAFERIAGLIVAGISSAMPVDAVYLDLHGAMVVESFDDGEGELLRRVRACVGPDIPVVVSLDLHANVTRQMLDMADGLVAYRTYPHVDMAETGRRAYAFLRQRLAHGKRFCQADQTFDFLTPICWQCTDIEPARGLYRQVAELESVATHVSYVEGFPAADFPECGQRVWAYAPTQAAADAAVKQLAGAVNESESRFAGKLYEPDEAVQYAMRAAEAAGSAARRPIVIADAQDNPGAGSNSDTTGMLRALLRNGAKRAAIGLIVDPATARQVCAAGAGQRIKLALGGHAGLPDDSPLEEEFLIEQVSDGKFDATGPFYGGIKFDLGPSACLRIQDVRVVVATNKAQMADQAMFRYVGIEPTEQDILVVKSAVHFRADFAPIAKEIIVATAPGSMPMAVDALPWQHLPAHMRLGPNGPRAGERM
ncbi:MULTISPECIES: M81 family metallopeptidase [unclassified Achromobacter]|uniref:M81 family metallopeptidase n=1 Tax=unclassified Achromobacter TaxID=2626865 RepID=UPI000B517453|nr:MULTISPECIES: M81 family metallopeptidase [unclassified Achromobacter]OWT68241.1 microcystin degradation protein MlrC [Achromobacter sp. HZ34]OWT70078.1 microcystin degradation protein MlrC [Achromobacter sp. HZ28]